MIIFTKEDIRQIRQQRTGLKYRYNEALKIDENLTFKAFLRNYIFTNANSYNETKDLEDVYVGRTNSGTYKIEAVTAYLTLKAILDEENSLRDDPFIESQRKLLNQMGVTNEALFTIESFFNNPNIPLKENFEGIDHQGGIKEKGKMRLHPENEREYVDPSKVNEKTEKIVEVAPSKITEDDLVLFDSTDVNNSKSFKKNDKEFYVPNSSVEIVTVDAEDIENMITKSEEKSKSTSAADVSKLIHNTIYPKYSFDSEMFKNYMALKDLKNGMQVSLKTLQYANEINRSYVGDIPTVENESKLIGIYKDQKQKFESRGFTRVFWFFFSEARKERENIKTLEKHFDNNRIPKDEIQNNIHDTLSLTEIVSTLNVRGLNSEKAYKGMYKENNLLKEKDQVFIKELDSSIEKDMTFEKENLEPEKELEKENALNK